MIPAETKFAATKFNILHDALPRNTNGGLRSNNAMITRKIKRLIKKKHARQCRATAHLHQTEQSTIDNEKQGQTTKSEQTQLITQEEFKMVEGINNERVRIATLNVRGMKQLGKREQIEAWMDRDNIDLLAIQETHLNTSHEERRKCYTWFFSGEQQLISQQVMAGGLAIFIKSTHLHRINLI